MSRDQVTLQLIANSLVYASEEMGLALRNAAYSPNIRERMDHSAAIFDSKGRLLAQAEHVPVHLGSLPWGMSNIISFCAEEGIELEEKSMVLANDPYLTGTHLNDVTVAVSQNNVVSILVDIGRRWCIISDNRGNISGVRDSL